MKKRCRVNKRGYFFLLDSVIALSVLAVGGFLIFASYTKTPSTEEATILSEDVMDFFANNEIKDVNNYYSGVGGELWNLGLITDTETTLLQQVGIFYARNELDIAEQFIAALTKDSFPSQYTFEFWINGNLLYPKNPFPEHLKSKNTAKALIPSKKIVYGILDKETGEMFGPYNAEVIVWK
ncbi:MAG: hypothetical protein V1831_00375 [Candidatus Woesearchaeota archaeon]